MSAPVRTFDRDGFNVKVFHVPDEDGQSDHYGEFGSYPKLTYPAWDRCKKRVVWDAADASHHRAENDNWDRGTHRYVHNFMDVEGVSKAEAEKYIRQNVARLESLGETWNYVVVDVRVYRAGVKLAQASLCGMESDGGAPYFAETEDDLTAEALTDAKTKLDELCAQQGATGRTDQGGQA